MEEGSDIGVAIEIKDFKSAKTIFEDFFGDQYEDIVGYWKMYGYYSTFHIPSKSIHLLNNLDSPLTMCLDKGDFNKFE